MNNLEEAINTVIHKPEPSRGQPQTHPSTTTTPAAPARPLPPGLCRRLRRQEAQPFTHRFLSVSRAGWASEGVKRCAMPPPPGSSRPQRLIATQRAAADRSRVRGMSVCRRPARRALGPPAFREPWGSASGGRGLGPEQGAWGGSLGGGFRGREHASVDPRETPTRARARTKAWRGPGPGRPQQGDPCREEQEGERPGVLWRLRGPRTCGLRRRGFPGAGSAPAPLARRHRQDSSRPRPRAEDARVCFWASRACR